MNLSDTVRCHLANAYVWSTPIRKEDLRAFGASKSPFTIANLAPVTRRWTLLTQPASLTPYVHTFSRCIVNTTK